MAGRPQQSRSPGCPQAMARSGIVHNFGVTTSGGDSGQANVKLMTVPSTIDESDADVWQRIVQQQHGIIHRSDVPPDVMRSAMRELRARRWRRVSRDVFVTHNGPLTPTQQLWAALKSAPQGSALSGLTAANLSGLRGFPSPVIQLTQPCGTRAVRFPGVVVHFSRFLDNVDVHPARVPRQTRIPRSLLDAASFTESDRYARAVLLAGVQQGIASVAQLRETLPRRGPCLRHALISETLDDADGGIQSVPEADFDRIRRRHGLPEPVRQRVIRRTDGRYYLDADWDEYALSAEVDGIPHLDVLNWDADLDRANELAIENRTILRFTSYAVRHNPRGVATVLARALVSRGWH
jgi:very-short-patch-repair endonuclease